MSIVNVEGLTHYFGDKLIFKNVDFRLLTNEHVGLVGPNGAGKSTLLQILTGSMLPDDGIVSWQTNVKVGFLEQHMELEGGCTIRQYLRTAFQKLYDIEEEMNALAKQMGNAQDGELDKLLNRFSKLQETLELHDFYLIEPRIEELSEGLGLKILGLDTDLSELSGGQRTKILLAKLLLEEPEVLLLDEPTNYLDFEHVEWLQQYLKNYPNSFILISHDTTFLNEVVNVIYHLEHKQLTRYIGNYKKFLETYEFRKQQIFVQYDKQQQEIQKLEKYVQKNKVRASTSKQAKSREKKLLKIDRIEKPDPIPKPRFSFRVSDRPSRIMVEIEKLVIGYDEPLLPPISFTLKRGEKVAITGHNGIGKSTMLKTIIGEIDLLSGRVSFGEFVKPSYFAQEWTTSSELTPLDYIWTLNKTMTQREVRQALARCGLKKDHILQSLHSLSGGEQTRVRLCQLMLEDSNWIILDEPTNHLDTMAKEVLAKALFEYEGTVVVVSHEPDFYYKWVTQIWDLADLLES